VSNVKYIVLDKSWIQMLAWRSDFLTEVSHGIFKFSQADAVKTLSIFVKRPWGRVKTFLISNFRRVLNVVRFVLGNSPASEIYMPTFQNSLSYLHRQVRTKNLHTYLHMKVEQTECSEMSFRHIKFRRRGITRKKAYKM